ncbi:MAG: hypothetical protein Q9164_003226 [Protoblastenia rupestris]
MVHFNSILGLSGGLLAGSHLANSQPVKEDSRNENEDTGAQLLPRVNEVTRKFHRYVAIGDSYSAGPAANGVRLPGENADGGDCLRTSGGWPQQLNDIIRADEFQFSACTGLNTPQIRDQQVISDGSLFGHPDLVTITTGGNDGDSFANVVKTCPYFYGRLGNNGKGCSSALRAARELVNSDGFRENIRFTVVEVLQRLAPRGVVMLMGYPKLYNQDTIVGVTGDCWLIRPRRESINQLVTDLNNVLHAVAATFNNQDPNFTIIVADPNMPNGVNEPGRDDKTFDGRRFCELKNRAYFQGLPNGESYSVESFYKGLFHPNLDGMAVMAQTAQNTLAGLHA